MPNLILRYDEIVNKGEHFASLFHGSDLTEHKNTIRYFINTQNTLQGLTDYP